MELLGKGVPRSDVRSHHLPQPAQLPPSHIQRGSCDGSHRSRQKSRLVVAAGRATEANQSLLERSVNAAERMTSFDIDGDGDVGEAGHKKGLSLAEVLRAATLAERNVFFDEARRENEEKASIHDRWCGK